jgi:hypothetical protein
MKDWAALKSPIAMLTVLVGVLVSLWGLIASPVAEFLVPPPEQEAETFFRSLHAHNYDAARETLSQALQAAIEAEDLQRLGQALEDQGLDDAQGIAATQQTRTASASVKLKFKNGLEKDVIVRLQKESGLWKLASLPAAQVFAR